MLLCTSKERAIFCYQKDLERLKRHLERLIPLVKDYKENKEDYTPYIYDIREEEYVENRKLTTLHIGLEHLNFNLRCCGFKEIDNIYRAKDYEDIIDYLEYLLER